MRNYNPSIMIMLALVVFLFINGGLTNHQGSLMDWFMSKVYILPGIFIGLCFHEFAHALAADKLGDPTPRQQGRVTIAPLAHIDWIGLVALFFLGFGWGKPVQINPPYYKHRRRDELIVALAGVLMNLLLAVVFTLILKVVIMTTGYTTAGMVGILKEILFYIIWINVVLLVFNLMPIPPLDGFNVLTQIFDLQKFSWWYKVYDFGWVILMVFIISDASDVVIAKPATILFNTLYRFAIGF